MSNPELNQLFSRPLSNRACAFLRDVKFSGGTLHINGVRACQSSSECQDAGYIRISADDRHAELTELGQAFLDRTMRAH